MSTTGADADLNARNSGDSSARSTAPPAAHGSTQYLTAVFELRPSRRKAAVLEYVRSAAENLFWEIVGGLQAQAATISEITDLRQRKVTCRSFVEQITQGVLIRAVKQGLCEPVARGLNRDVVSTVTSYIELRGAGHPAEWPTRTVFEDRYATGLDAMRIALTKEEQLAARDTIAAGARGPNPRPLIIARSRDAQLVRRGVNGPLAVILRILRSTDPRARRADIEAGIVADSGEPIKALSSTTKLVVPVSCSKWHEMKFLSGNAVLRSSIISRVGDRWFLGAQFEHKAAPAVVTESFLGVDRGIVNPVATAISGADGRIIAIQAPAGRQIGQTIRAADGRRRTEQRRRGTTSVRHVEQVEHVLHGIANRIVLDAKAFRARVVIANLDGLKQSSTAGRDRGTVKGALRPALKKAQLGKLEQILKYKLAMAGCPAPLVVSPAGTSRVCLVCCHADPANRKTQAKFACTSCGFEAHADTVGAVNIARRGAALKAFMKGVSLAVLEQDMVARLRLRSDTGLGPLGAKLSAASGFVAARASAEMANDLQGPTVTAGRILTRSTGQNARQRVVAEPPGAASSTLVTGENTGHPEGPPASGGKRRAE